MATVSNGSSIYTTGRIQASDLNDIANHYRQWFSVNYSAPSSNTRIYASDWNNLRQAILNGAGSAYTLNNFPDWVYPNNRIVSMTWGNATANFSSTTITYTSNSSYTIPVGCNSITLNQLVGGGGGGGLSRANAGKAESRAASGGGGSGGLQTSITTNVSSGQVININIGSGGAGGGDTNVEGSNGGDSVILINNNTWVTASGGSGGSQAIANAGGRVNGTGGSGGSPNGNSGNSGNAASSTGGTGGGSPYNGYGAGGSGSYAESILEDPNVWTGKTTYGNSGSNGYASITFNP